jgi:hypothetical protein
MDASVTVIDADSNRPIIDWCSGKSGRRSGLFDLKVTASRLMSRAITQAYLAVIPLQPDGTGPEQGPPAVSRNRRNLIRSRQHRHEISGSHTALTVMYRARCVMGTVFGLLMLGSAVVMAMGLRSIFRQR